MPPYTTFAPARNADMLLAVDHEQRTTAIREASRQGLATTAIINFNPT